MDRKTDISFQTVSQAMRSFPLPEIDLVLGVGRGGVVPASMLAHQLRCDLKIVQVNHRNDDNYPVHEIPVFVNEFAPDFGRNTRILLVDDVSVSGRTLAVVKAKLERFEVKTFVLKGRADFVLFPEIKNCVNWPWKILNYANEFK